MGIKGLNKSPMCRLIFFTKLKVFGDFQFIAISLHSSLFLSKNNANSTCIIMQKLVASRKKGGKELLADLNIYVIFVFPFLFQHKSGCSFNCSTQLDCTCSIAGNVLLKL